MVLICAGSIPSVRITAYAAVKSVTYDLGQLLGISADLSPYTTVVGESVSKDGITVTLNEVIMDENMMYITDTVTTPEKMDTVEKQMGYMADAMVFINGKMASSGAAAALSRQTIITWYPPWRSTFPILIPAALWIWKSGIG